MLQSGRSGRRFVSPARDFGVQNAVPIKPDWVYGEKTVEVLFGIPFLMIDQPELAIGAGHDAMMARSEDIPASTGDGR